MKFLPLFFITFALVNANPIIVEPVNPAVASGISKIESLASSIPLANSVQSIPSVVSKAVVDAVSSVVPSIQKIAPSIVPKLPVVPSVAAAAPVPVASDVSSSPVVPSNYAPKEVAPQYGAVPNVPVDPSVPVKQVPVVPVSSAPVSSVPVASVPVASVPVSSVPVSSVPVSSVPVSSIPVSPISDEIGAVISSVGSKVVPAVAVAAADAIAIAEKNSADPSAILSGPIDQATKLVIDLDEHIKKYLPAEDEIVTTLAPHIYAGDVAESEAERQQNQMTALIDQVNRLAESIENTITDLVARRRYVTAAMLRSMLNYVRRVRINLERLQNRLQSVQAVATSGQNSPSGSSPSASNIPGAAFFTTIRDRINRMTEEIGALVTRIRGSFTPGSNVTTSPLPPLVTAANLENIGAAAASGSIVSAINTVNSVPQQNAVVASQ